jgi:hypothetical protein
MFKEIAIFIGGVATGVAVALGLDDKDETSWETYNETEKPTDKKPKEK